MNKLIFHPGDFKPILDLFDRNQVVAPEYKAAEIAQSIFDEWLKRATVVYGQAEGRGNPEQYDWAKNQISSDTHKALLICIEPIKPKCEKHEPLFLGNEMRYDFNNQKFGVIFSTDCKHCGQQIEPAGWKEKE